MFDFILSFRVTFTGIGFDMTMMVLYSIADFQVSLWGGDAMFSNLDLRLDVLERELGLPFSFVSGHIHELHIHVPWTRLHAEPIVITINTIGTWTTTVHTIVLY